MAEQVIGVKLQALQAFQDTAQVAAHLTQHRGGQEPQEAEPVVAQAIPDKPEELAGQVAEQVREQQQVLPVEQVFGVLQEERELPRQAEAVLEFLQ